MLCRSGRQRNTKGSEVVSAHDRDQGVRRRSSEGEADGDWTNYHGLSMGGSPKTILRKSPDFSYLIVCICV